MWEALDLPCDMFMLCYKNHTVDTLRRTPEGREYLEDCERLQKTKLDKKGLKNLMRMMGGE